MISCPSFQAFSFFCCLLDFVSWPPKQAETGSFFFGNGGNGQNTNHLDGLMRSALLSLNLMEFEDDAGSFVELLHCWDGCALCGWLVRMSVSNKFCEVGRVRNVERDLSEVALASGFNATVRNFSVAVFFAFLSGG